MTTLRQRLLQGEMVFSTGVWDTISAIIVEKAGFDALHLASVQTCASLGLPDLGLMTPEYLREAIYRITDHTSVPLIVDFESGFGDAIRAAYWAKQFERSGASGIHIDDYGEFNKCPWLPPYLPTLESVEAMSDRIKAICDARKSEDFLVIARTGAPYSSGYSNEQEALEEGIRRARIWKEAGADVIWGRAFTNEGLKRFRDEVEGPICTQIGLGHGRTFADSETKKAPEIDKLNVYSLYEDLGYQLIFSGVTLFPVVLQALLENGREFRKTGDVAPLKSKALSSVELQDLVGFESTFALRTKYPTGGISS
ncbi:oxaloacetate decarboxylase [Thermodesulfobacteriota bacterium]